MLSPASTAADLSQKDVNVAGIPLPKCTEEAVLNPVTEVSTPDTVEGMLARVQRGLIGNGSALTTPFGTRPLIYADYTASGRSLDFVEDAIRYQVLPSYANTHTESSFTGARTSRLREAARQAIRASVNAGPQDNVVFCGPGATSAINRLVDILELRRSTPAPGRIAIDPELPAGNRPVVFVGPYEHHSNELPWRESVAEVVRIGLDAAGGIDQEALAIELENYRGRLLLIGSFSAASNVTGVCSDVAGITALLKASGALAFWDYAAAGPYLQIDMNPSAPIDAVFLSPHKFVGGPGTPGILIAKNHLFRNRVPSIVGGGTVSYVSPTAHKYLDHPEHREEGGTPAIVESIRAGLVFQVKDSIGTGVIEQREHAYITKALAEFATVETLQVLGPRDVKRLGIVSLLIKYQDKYLHHGFVAALLNDLFGIQARGGCSCAGPYGHDLLGIDETRSEALENIVASGLECFKPGWLRFSLHYAATPEEIDYLIAAIKLVAIHGWRLLPAYQLDPLSGIWRHRDQQQAPKVDLAAFLDGSSPLLGPSESPDLATTLIDVEQRLRAGGHAPHQHELAEEASHWATHHASAEAERWFVLPWETAERAYQ